jgi:hypothetical protein
MLRSNVRLGPEAAVGRPFPDGLDARQRVTEKLIEITV